MTEEGWLSCERPGTIFDYLRDHLGEDDRKMLLFSVACCRLTMQEAPATFQDRHRRAIDMIERHADGFATGKQMRQACNEIPSRVGPRSELVLEVGRFSSGVGARLAARALGQGGNLSPLACHLLRDILGNPFRPAVMKREWVVANDRSVEAVARAIYQDRAFDRMPILGDALEDADCDDETILAHCRGPGPHVRGCWVVDMLLGLA